MQIIIPTSWMRKLRLREKEVNAQSHSARKQQNYHWNPCYISYTGNIFTHKIKTLKRVLCLWSLAKTGTPYLHWADKSDNMLRPEPAL